MLFRSRISVIRNIYALDIAFHQPGLLLRKRSAKGRHRVVDSARMKADHIHIAFHHYKVTRVFPLLHVQRIQIAAFIVNRRITSIDVFWLLVLLHCACAKADYPAARSDNGENYAVAVSIVATVLPFPANCKPGVDQLVVRVALPGKIIRQAIPCFQLNNNHIEVYK